jgi:transcriptional regulator with XRE-family HTH domain
MPRKIPTEYDRYIGQRIREARIAATLSQSDLADMLGVSYQQIQKYEKGRSRISGARLDRLVSAVNRPFNYFFPNATDIRQAPAVSAFMATKLGQQLAEDVPQLTPEWQTWLGNTVKRLKESNHG